MRKSIIPIIALFVAMGVTAQPAESQTSYNAVKKRAAEFFKVEEYETLDRLAEEYLTDQTRSPSGLWLLSALYKGLEEGIDGAGDEASIIQAERRFLEWAERYPASTVARIGYGVALKQHAWFFRGTGMASTVEEENWTPFREYVEKVRVHLAGIEEIGEIDPHWYNEMLTIGQLQHWPLDEFMELVYQGLDLHPYYYQIHFSTVGYLLPKWHGSLEAVEEFAGISADYTRELEGEGMYARVQWQLSYHQLGKDLFTKGYVDWTRMSAGIDDVLARYPDQLNLNLSARFSCMAGDEAKTREIFARIGEDQFYGVWPKYGPGFDECREWANG